MKNAQSPLEKIQTSQRDLWIVSSVVLLALSGGFALLWPAVQEAARSHLGTEVSARTLLMSQLGLVACLIVYLWGKGAQIGRLTRSLAQQRGRTEGLEIRLDTVRSLLQATAHLTVDRGTSEGLLKVLEELTVALKGDRAVLHRVSPRGELERDAAFPTTSRAQDLRMLDFEDEVAERVLASGQILGIGAEAGEQGFRNPPPRKKLRSLVATPVTLDGEVVGVLTVRNPESLEAESLADEDRELLMVFASFAAGVVRNLRLFQKVADKNAELDRAHQDLRRAQSDLAEVDTATSLTCIASSMAHSLSGPLTAMRGYVDVLRQVEPRSRDALRARTGLEREFFSLRDRLQTSLDTLSQLRSRYELVDLDELVREAAGVWRDQNPESRVSVAVESYGNLPLTVVDSLRVRQVLLSVLRHASRSAEQLGGDSVVKVATAPETGRIHVDFRFATNESLESSLRHLADPHVPLAELGRSEGLELAVACGIVRQHCGDVHFESEDGRLTLRVTLPVRRDAPPPPTRVFPVSCGLEEGSAEAALQEIFEAGVRDTGELMHEKPVIVEPMREVQDDPLCALDTSGLFGPADLWEPGAPDDSPPLPAPPPPKTQRRTTTVDPGEVERALAVLDQHP